MHIWDTGGSDRFRAMVSLYYRDAAAAIICYDVTDERSFASVQYWVDEMENNCGKGEVVLALCGNKCDIDDEERKVNKSSAETMAKRHRMINKETSAKTGQGIKQLFGQIAQTIVDNKR